MQARFAGMDWASQEHAACVVDVDVRTCKGAASAMTSRAAGVVQRAGRARGGAGRRRAPRRVVDRTAAGRRAARDRRASQPGRRDPLAVHRRGRQERQLRRVRARRTGAHRQPSFPDPRPGWRSDQGAARADPRTRGPRRHARRAGQPAARPAGVLLARRRAIFADIDSPIALAFLKRYPAPPDTRGLGKQRLERFLARHHYCGRRPPANCSRGCAAPPRAAPTPSRPRPAARSSSASSPRWIPSSSRSRS